MIHVIVSKVGRLIDPPGVTVSSLPTTTTTETTTMESIIRNLEDQLNEAYDPRALNHDETARQRNTIKRELAELYNLMHAKVQYQESQMRAKRYAAEAE